MCIIDGLHNYRAAVDATVPAADGVQAKAQRDVHIEEVDAALISSISIFNVLSLRACPQTSVWRI